MSLKQIAVIFGTLFVVVGALGWVPAVSPGGKLLGIVANKTADSVLHVVIAIVALYLGFGMKAAAPAAT